MCGEVSRMPLYAGGRGVPLRASRPRLRIHVTRLHLGSWTRARPVIQLEPAVPLTTRGHYLWEQLVQPPAAPHFRVRRVKRPESGAPVSRGRYQNYKETGGHLLHTQVTYPPLPPPPPSSSESPSPDGQEKGEGEPRESSLLRVLMNPVGDRS